MPPSPAKRPGPVSVPLGGSSHDRILRAAKQLFASRGYENTSTVAIARLAGTSESQLMKHFGSKEGLLEAIFEQGWSALAQGFAQIQALPSPAARMRALLDMMLKALEADHELKELMLLEGRRIRREGQMVMMTQGFTRFVGLIDSVFEDLKAAGKLRLGVHPQAARSAVIGMMEGLLRDQLLATRVGFSAAYSREEMRPLFERVLGCLIVE